MRHKSCNQNKNMDEKLAVVNDVIFGNLANFWEAFSFEQRYDLICCRSLRPVISEPRLYSPNYGHRSLVPRRFWMTKTTLKWIIPNSFLFYILSKIVYIKQDLMSKLQKNASDSTLFSAYKIHLIIHTLCTNMRLPYGYSYLFSYISSNIYI